MPVLQKRVVSVWAHAVLFLLSEQIYLKPLMSHFD